MMDIDQMRDEVQGIARDTSAERRRDRYNAALITTLLDVAESLRTIAAESAYAMHIQGAYDTVTESDEGPGDAIVVGSVVYAEHIDGPGEVKGFGETEGKALAVVDFGGNQLKVWLDDLHLLTGDEGDEPDPLAEVIIEQDVSQGKPTVAEEALMDEMREPEVTKAAHVLPFSEEEVGHLVEPDPETDFDVDPLEVVKRKAAARKKKGTEK